MTLQELIDAQPDHWRKGKAGDGKIYLSDDGEKVKLNARGYPYKIGDDGRRLFKTSLRPKILLKNGVSFLNPIGTPSSRQRRRRRSWTRKGLMRNLRRRLRR